MRLDMLHIYYETYTTRLILYYTILYTMKCIVHNIYYENYPIYTVRLIL